MKRIIAVLLTLVLTAALLAGCATKPATPDPSDSSLSDIMAKGQLVIGLDDTFAPMGFRNEANEIVGFDIDLAKAVCAKLGVEPVFQPISWDAKEMELNSKKIDCIWNGMSATPERAESMSLSNNYLNNKIIVMTVKGTEIKTKEEIANIKVGIQAKSAALEAVTADPSYGTIKPSITEYNTYDEVIMDMQAGRLQAMIVDEVFGSYKNAKLGNIFTVSTVDFGDDFYAIGFRKADLSLTQAVNKAIADLVAEGKAGEISTAWFGADIMIK